MVRRQAAEAAMSRLVDSSQFERVLRAPRRAGTAHFAAHHLALAIERPAGAHEEPGTGELSTEVVLPCAPPVENFPHPGPRAVGAVVPKRHARRAVTRSLLKRQIYAAADRHAAILASGLWIVRLRAPFERCAFPSAASNRLRQLARAELDALFGAAAAGRA